MARIALAAALAEVKEFDKAVEQQTLAIDTGIKNEKVLNKAKEQLEHYKNGRPYREMARK